MPGMSKKCNTTFKKDEIKKEIIIKINEKKYKNEFYKSDSESNSQI